MRTITIIGTGYVGLVSGVCFAEIGHQVICVDNDEKKIKLLKSGRSPIYEEGLEALIKKNIKIKRLSFTSDIKAGVQKSEVIFIAVNTPPHADGSVDMYYVESVSRSIAEHMNGYKLIIDKSTVPVETGVHVEDTIRRNMNKKYPFDIASNPEFLKEGSAIEDSMHPDRIVIGVNSKRAEAILRDIYKPFNAPFLVTDIKSAEIIKHASNSFLATKISFINSIANICERSGADVMKVAEGMGFDERIGRSFLNPGIGFGGSCFPKDISGFIWISQKLGFDFKILKAVKEMNEYQRATFVNKIEECLWIVKDKTICVLGLAFKPGTDDMRNAPATEIITSLISRGAKIKAYDPAAMPKSRSQLPGVVKYAKTAYDALRGADCAVILTEWDEFKNLDIARMKKLLKHPVVVDGRNIFDPGTMKKHGFTYKSIGR
jgi:UDPglucose 6-dehydrogenase